MPPVELVVQEIYLEMALPRVQTLGREAMAAMGREACSQAVETVVRASS
jgi:hypothetical protein